MLLVLKGIGINICLWWSSLVIIIFIYPFPWLPYEALYGRTCRSLIGLFKVGESLLLVPDLIYKTLEKVHIISNRLQTAYSHQNIKPITGGKI